MRTTLSKTAQKLTRASLAVAAVFATALGLPASVFAEDVFGKINPPAGVDKYNSAPGVTGGIGLMLFISNLIKLSTIVAGLWVFVNFILAGWIYVTSSGDAGAHKKVADKMTMSIMGLMIIVGAYTIAALLGLIIFGDAGYILNPKLKGI